MKIQTTKKIFAFIIMMFSISFIAKSQCKGNKVQMCRGGGGRSGGNNCISKCVSPDKVDTYQKKGWGFLCPCTIGPGIAAKDKKKSKTSETSGRDKPVFSEQKLNQSAVAKRTE